MYTKTLSNAPHRIDNHKEETIEISAPKEEQPNLRREDMNNGEIVRRGSTTLRDLDSNVQNVETSSSDTKAARGKNYVDHTELSNPDMQRNAISMQIWADKLSLHGAEVTCSQLKNWLNNRKARLARVGKDARVEVDNASPQMKQAVPQQSRVSTESPAEDNAPSSGRGTTSESTWIHMARDLVNCARQPLQYSLGQRVVLVDGQGSEVAKGKVSQVKGKWYGKSLEDDYDSSAAAGLCVVDVTELKADRSTQIPYPSETTGATFGETESRIGEMRVLWDPKHLYLLRSG